MHPVILDIMQRQQRDGFPDFVDADVAATIPISDRLVNEIIAGLLPKGGTIREVEVHAQDGNRITAKIQLSVGFLPSLSVALAIDDQPHLPDRAVLALKLSQPSGLLAMAASSLPGMVTLPPGISIDGERILIDIRRALAERSLEGWLEHVTDLRVTTRPGSFVLDLRGKVGKK